MAEEVFTYPFNPNERALFVEIYFPQKAVYQERVYRALNDGLRPARVRSYLFQNADALLTEFALYPSLLDPMQYVRISRLQNPLWTAEAQDRIAQYESVFFGWSRYQVDGVFYNEEEDRIDDETTQVIRLLLRFASSIDEEAINAGCSRVLREILQWVIGDQDRFEARRMMSLGTERDQQLFMATVRVSTTAERVFAENHFATITREAAKWLDDCVLFIFGYLVRNFWRAVLDLGTREDEI